MFNGGCDDVLGLWAGRLVQIVAKRGDLLVDDASCAVVRLQRPMQPAGRSESPVRLGCRLGAPPARLSRAGADSVDGPKDAVVSVRADGAARFARPQNCVKVRQGGSLLWFVDDRPTTGQRNGLPRNGGRNLDGTVDDSAHLRRAVQIPSLSGDRQQTSVVHAVEPIGGNWGAGRVVTQTLETLAVSRGDGRVGV